jgi:hypothetical protein
VSVALNVFFAIGGMAGLFAIVKVGFDLHQTRKRDIRDKKILHLLETIARNTGGKKNAR